MELTLHQAGATMQPSNSPKSVSENKRGKHILKGKNL